MISLCEPEEVFILNDKLLGHDYFQNLERIQSRGFRLSSLWPGSSFAGWPDSCREEGRPGSLFPGVRNLIGFSKCIMGLIG